MAKLISGNKGLQEFLAKYCGSPISYSTVRLWRKRFKIPCCKTTSKTIVFEETEVIKAIFEGGGK